MINLTKRQYFFHLFAPRLVSNDDSLFEPQGPIELYHVLQLIVCLMVPISIARMSSMEITLDSKNFLSWYEKIIHYSYLSSTIFSTVLFFASTILTTLLLSSS